MNKYLDKKGCWNCSLLCYTNIASIVAKNQDWDNTDEDGEEWDQCFNSCENHQTGIANKWILCHIMVQKYKLCLPLISSSNYFILKYWDHRPCTCHDSLFRVHFIFYLAYAVRYTIFSVEEIFSSLPKTKIIIFLF